jgi:hypothetical protein
MNIFKIYKLLFLSFLDLKEYYLTIIKIIGYILNK